MCPCISSRAWTRRNDVTFRIASRITQACGWRTTRVTSPDPITGPPACTLELPSGALHDASMTGALNGLYRVCVTVTATLTLLLVVSTLGMLTECRETLGLGTAHGSAASGAAAHVRQLCAE